MGKSYKGSSKGVRNASRFARQVRRKRSLVTRVKKGKK